MGGLNRISVSDKFYKPSHLRQGVSNYIISFAVTSTLTWVCIEY